MTRRSHPLPPLLVLLLFGALSCWIDSTCNAEKDGDYYLPGFSNPNALNEMYWKDSINVLQDLDQFDALYVTYHGCVWSKYGTRYGSGQNYDEQGQDQPDDDNYQNGCGGFGGEYFWYMGRTQCFKANVAFTLYGTLKGSSNTGCTQDTYINGFFTTFGAESFTGPLGLGTNYGTSQCTSQEPQNMYLDSHSAAADDDYLDDKFQFYDYQAYTSVGTGCSNEREFVTDQYTGAFCHGQNYVETIDTLTSFNTQLKTMQCTKIYDGSQKVTEYDNDGDYNFAKMSAIDLLSFSKSCSLRQYPDDCPDPYGVKKQYAKTKDKAFYLRTSGNRDLLHKAMGYITYVFAAIGVLLLIMSCLIRQRLQGRSKNSNNHNKSLSVGSVGSGTSRQSRKERRRQREAKREAQHKENKRRSRSTTPKKLHPNDASRTKSRSRSRDSSLSSSKRSASNDPKSSTTGGGGGSGGIGSVFASSGQYEAPQWSNFGRGDMNRIKSLSPTRTQDITTVKSASGTVSIAITETINNARSWAADDSSGSNKRQVKAGSFSKFFPRTNS